jgi:membrane protein implicated in regulation of membrane protease activity
MIDYFISHLWQLWALISLLCLILELTNGDFFILCFAIGGVFAAVASAITDSLVVQILVFAAATILSLIFFRPAALRWFHKDGEQRKSNAEALIGRIGRVSQTIPADGYGRVAIDGDVWKAKSASGEAIPEGRNVTVVARESTIITVK